MIVHESLPDAPEPGSDASLSESLRQQGVAWTVRSLTVNHVAARAFPATEGKPAGAYELRSEFAIPTTLPPNVYGFDAMRKRGRFMSARFTLVAPDGRTAQTEDVSLVWGDGKWLTGGRAKHNVPIDEALRSFVRKASDRAVQHLRRDLRDAARRPVGSRVSR